MKPTEKEAGEKRDRLPEHIKESYNKEFGLCAKPLWVFYAVECGFTEEGKKI